MLQVNKNKLQKNLILMLTTIMFFVFSGSTFYVPTNRDTLKENEEYTFPPVILDKEYNTIYETDNIKYFYREDRNVIAVLDKRINYVWKTGLDIPFPADIDNAIMDLTVDEKKELNLHKEAKLNTTYTGIANSLVTIEYFDESFTLKALSSGAQSGVTTKFTKNNGDGSKWLMETKFNDIDLSLEVLVSFEDNKINYNVLNDSIKGEGRNVLASIFITPFLGASGGAIMKYNPETDMFDIQEKKPMIPGYVFVPDGSGALIRFKDNSMNFSEYYGSVYGMDYSQTQYYSSEANNLVPRYNPNIPVFGISHGDNQAAFVSYATKGDEYMEIVVKPEENLTNYTFAYPKFIYNKLYYQVYNKKGDGFFKIFDNMNVFDISVNYEFIAPSDNIKANYVGMAQVYRKYLIENGLLIDKTKEINKTPIRIDFIMSEAKKNILSIDQVVLTDTNNVNDILQDLINSQVMDISVNLFGWQKGGITAGKPWDTSYNKKVGSKQDFINLVEFSEDNNIEMSFAQEYFEINKLKMNYLTNAAAHINSWYITKDINKIVPVNAPVKEVAYAVPSKSVEWLNKTINGLDYTKYATISGISNNLISDYSNNDYTSVEDAKNKIVESADSASQLKKLNFVNPNSYLFKYTNGYLDMPVFTSQHLIETDTVPFLQILLKGTMEMYAPYSNFSFYTDDDILRMIDYNVSPSFIISENNSYLLANTNSADFYSTKYEKYKPFITNIYTNVSKTLDNVIGYNWIDREVLQNGVILNTYTNGSDTKYIAINYTNNNVTYNDKTILAKSYYYFD